jgi:hypothetical protein
MGAVFARPPHFDRIRSHAKPPVIAGDYPARPEGPADFVGPIHARADYLLTGDARHFGHLYGKRIEGLLILRPAQYFERRRRD